MQLVDRVRQIVPAGVEVRWQVGNDFPDSARPDGAHSLVPADELRGWIDSADAVVAHGGVGSALTILRAGHQPVLVARRAQRTTSTSTTTRRSWSASSSSRGLAVAATPLDLTWDDIVRSTRTMVEPAGATVAASAPRRSSASSRGTRRCARRRPARRKAAASSASGGRPRRRRRVLVAAFSLATLFGIGSGA